MSWLAGLIGGGLSALGSIGSSGLSSALGQYNAQKSAKYQYNLYLKGLRQAPSAQVEGLRKANLNPLLATGLGGNVPSVGVSAPQPQVENIGSTALAGAINAQALKAAKANAKAAESSSALTQLQNSVKSAELQPILDMMNDRGYSISVQHGSSSNDVDKPSISDLIQSAYRAKLEGEAASAKNDAEVSKGVNNFLDGVSNSAKQWREYFDNAKHKLDNWMTDKFLDLFESLKAF